MPNYTLSYLITTILFMYPSFLRHFFIITGIAAFLAIGACNKQVPNNAAASGQESAKTLKSGQEIPEGDTSTYKTEYGTAKSLRSAEDIKAAEERKKADEPALRQQRVLEAGQMLAGKYCACKGSGNDLKACRDKVMEDVNYVLNDASMGLTAEEKNLFESTFNQAIKNCN